MKLLPLFFLLCLSAYAEKDLVGIQEGRIVVVYYNSTEATKGEVVVKNSEGLQIYTPNKYLLFFPWASVVRVEALSLEEEALFRESLRQFFPEGKFFPKGKY